MASTLWAVIDGVIQVEVAKPASGPIAGPLTVTLMVNGIAVTLDSSQLARVAQIVATAVL